MKIGNVFGNTITDEFTIEFNGIIFRITENRVGGKLEITKFNESDMTEPLFVMPESGNKISIK